METPNTAIGIRGAEAGDIETLALLWFDGWQDAHARILPAELARYRTFESFARRLQALLDHTRVTGPRNAPIGFCITQDDELYQLYVSTHSRGSGVAAALISDAEASLAQRGVHTAWLACAIGNMRAAKFYQKCGWRRVGTMVNQLETPDGMFPLNVWRYEKRLRESDQTPA
jgi:ribosomal protein S18 acetylase RimI-like enzyme